MAVYFLFYTEAARDLIFREFISEHDWGVSLFNEINLTAVIQSTAPGGPVSSLYVLYTYSELPRSKLKV